MGRPLRFPGLVDILRVDHASEIRPLAVDPRIDRKFLTCGPLINRILVRRIRSTLTTDGGRLPSIAPRENEERRAGQLSLERKLDPTAGDRLWDAETVARLSDAIRVTADAPLLGPAVQQAIGRLFVPGYRASQASWDAALCLNEAVQTRNPLRSLVLNISGRVRRSKRVLSRLVDGNRAGVHATGIAVHSLVRGFELMRNLWRDAATRDRLSADAVVGRCIVAPPSVLRQATEFGVTVSGTIRPGTLVLIDLAEIHGRTPASETAFMTGTWSRCPAAGALPVLLRAVWQRAISDAANEAQS